MSVDQPGPIDPAKGSGRWPRVSVVLLNCRAEEEADTAACIRSLQRSHYPSLEIILVDNGSPEGVADRLVAQFPEVTLIRTGANLGFTGGNNRGIEHALACGTDYVLALNNDTEVEPDCIQRLVETARSHRGVGCVGGKILYHEDPRRIWFGGGWFSAVRGLGYHRHEGAIDDPSEPQQVEEVSFLTGCCMLFPADALRAVGGFEEDFFIYVEDVELSLRLRRAGYRLLYQPAARLYHRIPVSEPPPPPHKIVLRDRNRRRMMRRRFRLPERVPFLIFFVASRMVHAARYAARGDWARLGAIWQGMITP